MLRFTPVIKYAFILILFLHFNSLKGQDSTAKQKALTYARKSEEFYKKGDNEKHKLYSDSLLFVAQQHELPTMELMAIMNQGIYYSNTNQLKKALETYFKVLKMCETVPNSEKNKIMTMVNMGNIYNNIQEADKAIPIFEKALPLIKKYPNNGYITAAAYSGLGKAYSILDHIDDALKYQYKLKNLADSLQHTYLQVNALTDIGDLYNKKKEYVNGLKIGKEALVINSTASDSILNKDLILLNIGIAYDGLKKIDTAKIYFEKAKAVAISKKNAKVEMNAEEYLAQIYEQLHDFKASQKSQKRYSELYAQNLKDQKNAAVLDAENEAEKKIQTIEDNSKTKTYILSASVILLLTALTGFFLFNRKRKQQIIDQNKQLRTDHQRLQNQYATLKENLEQLSKEKNNDKHNTEKYKNSSLTEQNREEYMNHILTYMEKEKPYLDFDLTQAKLAEKLEMNPHHLSEVLTLSFGQNFYSFINLHRIDTAIKLLKNPTFENYKIEAIAYDSGFKSKTSFNRVFKITTGKTPSEFRKR